MAGGGGGVIERRSAKKALLLLKMYQTYLTVMKPGTAIPYLKKT